MKPGERVRLKKHQTQGGNKEEKEEGRIEFVQMVEKISELQYALYAENRQALLIVLQGMDAAGKDSLIRHLMTGINPQGVRVSSFKHPSSLELDHDYLWRHYTSLPERGQIGIFNRSHYENVLITRVHPELILSERLPKVDSTKKVNSSFWKKRYEQIRMFEQIQHENGVHILKFFLNISLDEQRERFLDRIENPKKHWKFSSADIRERGFWKDYMHAYEEMLPATSTKDSPWYIIPSDAKWFARLLISHIVYSELQQMNPLFPSVSESEKLAMEESRKILIDEKS